MSFFRINGSFDQKSVWQGSLPIMNPKPRDLMKSEERITIDTESCTLWVASARTMVLLALYIEVKQEIPKSIECSAFCVENVPRSVRRNVCICQVSRWNRNLAVLADVYHIEKFTIQRTKLK